MSEIETKENLADSENNNSFGSGPRNSKGMRMEFYFNEKRDSVISWYSVPDHLCGWGNIVHGGIIVTMLDEAMGWACVKLQKQPFLSKSMTIDFMKPIFIGIEINEKYFNIAKERIESQIVQERLF